MPKCEKCDTDVPDYKPEYCCTGYMCGCGGYPLEPCLCKACWDKAMQQKQPAEPTGEGEP